MLKFATNLLRRKQATQEIARQLTLWDRRMSESPQIPPGPLPYATYSEMEKDAMIQTALTVKKLGVLAAPYEIVGESPQVVGFVQECFERMDGSPSTILAQAMDAFSKGWSIQEAVYEERNGRLALAAVRPKDPALFGIELDAFGRPQGLRLEVPGETVQDLPLNKFIVYANRGGYAKPKGRSDLDAAYPHYEAKSSLLKSWRAHLDKFASPTMLGRFGPSLTAEDREVLLSALNNLATSKSIVFPNEVEVSAIGGEKEASMGYMEAIEFHNREIARAILGQTLTTDEGRRVGSLALGKVHLQVLMLQLQAQRRELADVVMTEQVIKPLVRLNFGNAPVPVFRFEETDLSAFRNGVV